MHENSTHKAPFLEVSSMRELKIAVLGLEILGDLRAQRMLEPLHLLGVVAEVHLAVEGMQPAKRHINASNKVSNGTHAAG